jgi:hypothetical protein
MAAHEPARDDERARAFQRPASAPEREADPALRLASAVGNRAFGQLVAAAGGVLPDGRVHPDVEATILRSRGSGAGLDTGTQQRVGDAVGDSLHDVRIHTDPTADTLARSVGARAFATGPDVFFARGEYQPGTPGGDSLLAHELTHVAQQRGAPLGGPLTVTQPGDAFEQEADEVSRDLAG